MVQMDENGCGRRVDMLEDDVPVLMDPRQMEEEILPMEKKRQRVLLVERVVTGLFALAVVLWLIGDERRLGVEVGGTRRGVVASTLPVLCFGMLKFKDQMFTYPHPLFWRLVTSISLLYLMLIAYLSMQTTDDARKFMVRMNFRTHALTSFFCCGRWKCQQRSDHDACGSLRASSFFPLV